MGCGKVCGFVLLVLVVGANATGGRTLNQVDVLAEAGNALGSVLNNVQSGLFSLVQGLFGPANTLFTQIPADIMGMSWNSLLNLDLTDPIQGFLGAIGNLNLPSSILGAQNSVTTFLDKFCTTQVCTPAKAIPSNCVGKTMVVRLAPWRCALVKGNTVDCTPPFIEVLTAPAICTAKTQLPTTYVGKTCKLEKTFGANFTTTIGGDPFSINIPKNLLDIPQALKTIAGGVSSTFMGLKSGLDDAAQAALGGLGEAVTGASSSAIASVTTSVVAGLAG